jgi:FAD-dependent urate hydroxylase
MTTAVVVGSGIAGPVVGMALQRAGIDAVVLERDTGVSDAGAFLTLQVNGIDALRAIGADHVLDGLGFATPGMRLRSGTGKPLGEVSMGLPLDDGTIARTVRRADLRRVLREEALRRGVEIREGVRVTDAGTDSDGAWAECEDAPPVRGDLLVGADGIRSRVRSAIDPDGPPARYVPLLNLGGFAPPQETGARPGEYEMIFGKRAFFGYAVAPDGVWWFANPPRRDEPAPGELAAVTDAQWRAELAEAFADDAGPAARIVASTGHELAGWTTYDLPTVPRWHRGRMIVIGDAAHATSPSSGQGASMAIEDAVQLARCLRDRPTPEAAFDAFESLRRKRVEKVVATGARTSNTKIAGPVGRAVRDAMMPMIMRYVNRDGGASLAWQHRHHIDWDAPVGADGAEAARRR